MKTEPISRHPLQWPAGWKRISTAGRKDATFKSDGKRLSIYDGVLRVLAELEKLGVHQDDVIVSSNVRVRLDGMPRSGEPKPADPGVCVYWQKSEDTPMRCMAIDRYTEVADNLAAVAATLEAMRGIERHGGAAILDRVFTGLTALPPPAAGQRDWWTVLELDPQAASADDIKAAHRRLRSIHHSDKGGSDDRMAEINMARDAGLKGLGQ